MIREKLNAFPIQYLPIDDLIPNPINPRFIKDKRFKKLVKSLKDCPALFDARPCICSNRTGQLIILGGNQRWAAAKQLEYKLVPTIIMSGLTEDEEKEIAIKDNGEFGEWDFDILKNDWLDKPLDDWGIELEVKGDIAGKLHQEEMKLKPFNKVHVLISVDVKNVYKIANLIEKLKLIQGVEIEQSAN
jgi:ParB-like chromosome segregation protein Spo0J